MRRLALLPLLAFSLACGSDGTPTGGPPTPSLGNFPVGTYVGTIEESDVSDDYLYLVGTHRITFTSNATWNLVLNGVSVVTGRFSVSGSQISITDVGGNYSCSQLGPAYATGTYTWSLDGSTLSFVVVSDNCTGRVVGMTTSLMIRQ
jgi:hypothetical protein